MAATAATAEPRLRWWRKRPRNVRNRNRAMTLALAVLITNAVRLLALDSWPLTS